MTLALSFEPEAAEELEAAAVWYEAKRPGSGAEFIAAIDDALSMARNTPLAFATALGANDVRRVPLERFPYSAVYIITAETFGCSPYRREAKTTGRSTPRPSARATFAGSWQRFCAIGSVSSINGRSPKTSGGTFTTSSTVMACP